MKAETISITKILPNPENPRLIKDDKFYKLVESIKTFPEMLELRPIVVDENMMILGGNMRYKACIELNKKKVPVLKAMGLSDEQKREFVIKDNANFGDWDYDQLANSWDNDGLQAWGLDVWNMNEEEGFDTEDQDEAQGESGPKLTDKGYTKFEIIIKQAEKEAIVRKLKEHQSNKQLETIGQALVDLLKI